MRRIPGIVVCVVSVLAACGSSTSTTDVAVTSSSLAQSTVTIQASSTSVPSVAPSSTEATAPTEVAVSTVTPTTTGAGSSLVLRGDGLGDFDFGTPTAVVMETLVEVLGTPSPGEEYPYGGHPLRHVYWDDVGLSVIFSDYEFYRDDGVEHLAGWGHGPKPTGEPKAGGAIWRLRTAEGIGIGSTLTDIQATYGDLLVLEDAPCDGPPTLAYLITADPDDVRFRLFFYFDRETSDPAAQIAALAAGAGPGC